MVVQTTSDSTIKRLAAVVVPSLICCFAVAFSPRELLSSVKSIHYSGHRLAIRPGRFRTRYMNNPGCDCIHRHRLWVPPLAAKKNKWGNSKDLDEFCAEQESRAIAASESWIVEATGFLDPPKSSALKDKLEGRSDVSCLSVGSYRGEEEASRVRCVFANPDLGYDESTAESDCISYLKISNVAISQCDPWPNILVNIGLSLDTVGDIFLVTNASTAYLAVAPDSEKIAIRLLPKELPGTGVTVTKLSREDLDAELAEISDSDGEILRDMDVQRVDKRK